MRQSLVIASFFLGAVVYAADPPVKLNAPLVAGGDVLAHANDPGGERIVYLADQEVDGRDELYGVSASGGVVSKLNVTPVAGGDVLDFLVGPGPEPRVVYRADQETDERFDLYSVPIDGGTPVKLNPAGAPSVDTGYSISPDGAHVAFRTMTPRSLYVVPVSGGPPVLLSSVSPTTARFSPDGSHLVYQDGSTFKSLHVSTLAGSSTLLDSGATAQQGFSGWTFTPDGTRIVYRFFDFGALSEAIRSVASSGGSTLTHGSIGFGQAFLLGVSDVQVAGDYRVVFTLNDTVNGHVRSAPASSPGSSLLVSDPLVLSTVWITGDSQNVLANGLSLWSIPILDGTPVELSATVTGVVQDVAGSADGRSVVVRAVDGGKFELWSVATTGGTAVELNAPVASDRDVLDYAIGPGSTPVVYRADHGATDDVFDLFAVATTGGSPIELTGTAHVTDNWSLTADGTRVVYRADPELDGQIELYAVHDPILCSSTDLFDRSILPFSPVSFDWGEARDVDWVRGDLDGIATYELLESGTLSSATALGAPGDPASGDGWFYIVKPALCGGWETVPGGEPDRDDLLP